MTAWLVKAYIVSHDLKFGGSVQGLVQRSAEPAGRDLETIVAGLARHHFSSLGEPVPDQVRYDLISVSVTPSAGLP